MSMQVGLFEKRSSPAKLSLRPYQKEAIDATLQGFGAGDSRLLVVLPTGCLAGDTIINVNRAGKGFRVPIKTMVERMSHGGRYEWDHGIPTMARRAVDGISLLGEVNRAWCSGVKETYTLKTAAGYEIRATATHPFMTPDGFVNLGDLSVGSVLMVEAARKGKAERNKKIQYRVVAGLDAHPYANKFVGRRHDRRDEFIARVPVHRLVAEAMKNGLGYDEYVERVRSGKIDGIEFIDPVAFHVHHIDGNPLNNNSANLVVLTADDHLKFHANDDGYRNVQQRIMEDRVVSIEFYGEEETYDIEMSDDPHNFIANGFVVHNSGKTILASSLTDEIIGGTDKRALFIAHREELISQTVEKYRLMMGNDVSIGVVKAERDEHDRQIVVASIQTIQRDHRLERLGKFDLIITDEAHHVTAPSWIKALEGLGVFDDDGPNLFGMTATPNRADGVGIGKVFPKVAYEVPLFNMIRDGYLVDIKSKRVQVDIDFSKVQVRRGDYAAGAAGRALHDANAPEMIAKAIEEHGEGRQSIVFVPTVDVAEEVAEKIRDRGISAEAVSANTDKDVRRKVIDDLHSGDLRVVVNCGIFTEGTDIPPISCIVMASPTRSHGRFVQMLGRGLRPSPGKEDCLILDVVGASDDKKLVTTTRLFGLKPKDMDGDVTLKDIVAKQSSLAMDVSVAPKDGRLVAYDVDLMGREFHWIKLETGMFGLISKTRTYVIKPGGTNDMGIPAMQVWAAPTGGVPMLVHPGLSQESAQGYVESMVKDDGDDILAKNDVGWRKKPVSEKQRMNLLRRGMSLSEIQNIRTSGEASDAITALDVMKRFAWIRRKEQRAWERQ